MAVPLFAASEFWGIDRLTVSFGDRIRYAQFLHDASEIRFERMPAWQKSSCPVGNDSGFLALPNPRPEVLIPVIEVFLKDPRGPASLSTDVH